MAPPKLPNNEAAIQQVYMAYARKACEHKREFLISKDVFRSLIQQNCHYCNKLPSNKYKKKSSVLIYNGIDRKDNDIGYTIDNCVPCCRSCNGSKQKESYKAFMLRLTLLNK